MPPVTKPDLVERLLRVLYSAALYLLAPITIYHLIWRGFRQPAYLQRWAERYAVYNHDSMHPRTLWVHAVSVGEVNAALPLVQALRRTHPDLRLLVTTITPTGSERVRALWKDEVEHVYLPYDLPGAVGRFLDHYRPFAALIMETELWPNLLFGCRDRRDPQLHPQCAPVGAFAAWLPGAGAAGGTARCARCIRSRRNRMPTRGVSCAWARASSRRWKWATSSTTSTCPTASRSSPPSAARTSRAGRCGSRRVRTRTRKPTSSRSTAACARHSPDLLLLWAPRHPERFRAVAEQARSAGWRVSTRARGGWPQRDDAVFVVDTLGELVNFYACADVAFVGGSLQAIGGHNLLEPAATGTAIVTGPHLHNFAEIAHRLEHAGALKIGADAEASAAMSPPCSGIRRRGRAWSRPGTR
jgi:3-deoxy-D-manno-octulosonic-acid transferase